MTFKQYLAESEKTFNYRLKTVSLLDKKAVASIEKYFQRFNLVKISTVRKTPLQKTPLDFESVSNREVFMLDVTLGLPISSFIMQRELVGILGLPGDYLLVRGENDPIEIQTDVMQQQSEIAAQAAKKNLTADSLLGTDSVYPEAEQTADGSNYYGDSYNSRLLSYLQTIADERKEKEKVVAKAPLFSWLDLPKEETKKEGTKDSDFNFYHGADLKAPDLKAKTTTKTGNFDDEGVVVKKTYKTKSGDTKTLAGKPTSIRKKD
jgi:hypothetical protein